MKKKLIGYAICYKNRSSFVIYEKSFYSTKSKELEEEIKEYAKILKKKLFIKKVYFSF